jgi:hypothetical protein
MVMDLEYPESGEGFNSSCLHSIFMLRFGKAYLAGLWRFSKAT